MLWYTELARLLSDGCNPRATRLTYLATMKIKSFYLIGKKSGFDSATLNLSVSHFPSKYSDPKVAYSND